MYLIWNFAKYIKMLQILVRKMPKNAQKYCTYCIHNTYCKNCNGQLHLCLTSFNTVIFNLCKILCSTNMFNCWIMHFIFHNIVYLSILFLYYILSTYLYCIRYCFKFFNQRYSFYFNHSKQLRHPGYSWLLWSHWENKLRSRVINVTVNVLKTILDNICNSNKS